MEPVSNNLRDDGGKTRLLLSLCIIINKYLPDSFLDIFFYRLPHPILFATTKLNHLMLHGQKNRVRHFKQSNLTMINNNKH